MLLRDQITWSIAERKGQRAKSSPEEIAFEQDLEGNEGRQFVGTGKNTHKDGEEDGRCPNVINITG